MRKVIRTAVLLLSNRTDYAVRDRYRKLVDDCGGKADVYLLFDATRSYDVQALSDFQHVYPFNLNDLIGKGYTPLKDGVLGNCHLPVLAFHSDHPDYDYYWVIEDDVIFSGDWSVLFDAFARDRADLVAARVRKYKSDPDWYWWFTLKAPDGSAPPEKSLYAAFIPVYRLSAKAIECLYSEMRNGWTGFFEGLVPTLLVRNGLTLRDINGKDHGLFKR